MEYLGELHELFPAEGRRQVQILGNVRQHRHTAPVVRPSRDLGTRAQTGNSTAPMKILQLRRSPRVVFCRRAYPEAKVFGQRCHPKVAPVGDVLPEPVFDPRR
eukprot:2885625-Pyramimonas_sp.AAC.1